MDLKPSSKTVATLVATGVVTIGVWGIGLANVEVPSDVATAAVALISILIAWLAPATSGKYVDTTGGDDLTSGEGTYIGDFEDVDDNPDELIVDDTPTSELTDRDHDTIATQEHLDQMLAAGNEPPQITDDSSPKH